jgi:hypothetical protein
MGSAVVGPGRRSGSPRFREAAPMNRRRALLVPLLSALVASVVVIGPAIADELLGVITTVDASAKKVTVVEKGTDKEVVVTVTDDTEWVTPKGTNKLDLEKLSKNIEKAKEKGRKGISVKVTHEKATASKIEMIAKKAAVPPSE